MIDTLSLGVVDIGLMFSAFVLAALECTRRRTWRAEGPVTSRFRRVEVGNTFGTGAMGVIGRIGATGRRVPGRAVVLVGMGGRRVHSVSMLGMAMCFVAVDFTGLDETGCLRGVELKGCWLKDIRRRNQW